MIFAICQLSADGNSEVRRVIFGEVERMDVIGGSCFWTKFGSDAHKNLVWMHTLFSSSFVTSLAFSTRIVSPNSSKRVSVVQLITATGSPKMLFETLMLVKYYKKVLTRVMINLQGSTPAQGYPINHGGLE